MVEHLESSMHQGYMRRKAVETQSDNAPHLTVEPTRKYQRMLGFGGAFTEAAAYTFFRMSEANQAAILNAYFDCQSGLRYNLGRVHINSCDFSLENYTYVDVDDESLDSFCIDRERRYVIPMIHRAHAVRGASVSLLASPWSPPAWMKTNNSMNHGGSLKPKYADAWARYYVKYLEAMDKEGLDVFAISVQNEPAATQTWDSCVYSAEEERDFVKKHLGPTLKQSPYRDTNIIVWDHNRDILVERADTVLKDKEANAYVWGTGVHWYVSEAFENLTTLHERYPDKHILFTEGCIEGGVRLNDFTTAERYARNMIGDIANHCEGYIDWNLVLDENGGPNHVGNYCDAPIICDTTTDTVHINSSYYAIGHFSRFVDEGAHRVHSSTDHPFVRHVAFENPDGSIVIVLQNETDQDTALNVDTTEGVRTVQLQRRSISTLRMGGKTL